jgi:hypothetical protein
MIDTRVTKSLTENMHEAEENVPLVSTLERVDMLSLGIFEPNIRVIGSRRVNRTYRKRVLDEILGIVGVHQRRHIFHLQMFSAITCPDDRAHIRKDKSAENRACLLCIWYGHWILLGVVSADVGHHKSSRLLWDPLVHNDEEQTVERILLQLLTK